jgi:hypothetical protein
MFAKTFRNTLIASTLVIAGAALATPAHAGLTDDVPLEGTVASTTAITATPTGAAGALNLGGEGAAANNVVVNVATLDILSNNTAGVRVTATAAGSLTSLASTEALAYRVRIDAVGATPDGATDFAGISDTDDVLRGAGGLVDGVASRELFIEYDAPSVLDAATYTSNITVVVADL